jgi:LacI family transcriptional regulator
MTKSSDDSPSNIRDVARLANVSVATISRFLNNPDVVSEDTRQRVKQAMVDLKYVPNAAARNLAHRKTNTLGLLLTDIRSDFFTPMLRGIEGITNEEDYRLLISTVGTKELPNSLPLGPENTDGLIIFLDTLAEDQIRTLYSMRYPMVIIHHTPSPDLPIPVITIENKDAAYRLVSHLIETHNRRHIAYLKGPLNNEDSTWREIGYKTALADHQITFVPGWIGFGNFDRTQGYLSTKKMLAEHPEVDAIFAGDDETAVGVLRALHEFNIRVPQDISVVGFDDQILSPFLNPPLTTIHAPTEEVGIAATKLLIQLIRTGRADPITLLPTDLVIRQSCGCNQPGNS